jgi:serine/threonine-protein kinase
MTMDLGRPSGTRDRFRVLIELGEGGTANVFLAVARGPSGFNKLVVLKVLKHHLSNDLELRRSFLHEARLSARLNHPNVVSVNEVTEQDGVPTIVMEYLEGQALSGITVRAGDQFTLPMHVRVLSDSMSGLHYSHELTDYDGTPLNLVHRDFTPQNVFVTFDGVVKVLDFGIAKVQNAPGHTETGVIKGKLRYMPPEQILGDELDRRADIYAVGAMLWEAATGQRFWRDLGEATIMHRVINGDIPSPKTVAPDCPDELERICMKALSPDRTLRYDTALELQQELEQFLATWPEQVSNQEIGAAMGRWFADVRSETKKTVERKLSEESSLSLVGSESGSGSRIVQKPKRGRTALVALLLLAFVGVPVLILAKPWAPREATGAASAAVASASARPKTVLVRVTVFPAEAGISIDGKPVNSNPYTDEKPADGEWHVLRAEAAGFTPIERRLKFDLDVDMVLVLQPLPTAAPSATAPPPSRQRQQPAAAPRPAAAPQPAPVKPKSDPKCSPPYYLDERGIKKYKPGCL